MIDMTDENPGKTSVRMVGRWNRTHDALPPSHGCSMYFFRSLC